MALVWHEKASRTASQTSSHLTLKICVLSWQYFLKCGLTFGHVSGSAYLSGFVNFCGSSGSRSYALLKVILSNPLCKDGNSTIDPLIWLKECSFLIISPLFLVSKKCASHFLSEKANRNKQLKKSNTWISNLYLIIQSFYGYHWKSGITTFT